MTSKQIWPWKRTELANQLRGLKARKCLAPNDVHTLALKLASLPAGIVHDVFPNGGKSMQVRWGSRAEKRRIALPAAPTVLADLGHPWTSTPWLGLLRPSVCHQQIPKHHMGFVTPTYRLATESSHSSKSTTALLLRFLTNKITILPTKTRKSLGRWSKKKWLPFGLNQICHF